MQNDSDPDWHLSKLIEYLELSPVQSDQRAKELHRLAFEVAFEKMQTGQSYGQAIRGPAILNQDEVSFRAELKSIDNDLRRQVEIVRETIDLWFEKGEVPPPYYPWRIAIILSKEKRKDDEARFLAAWCKHFGHLRGGRYKSLADRAQKLGVGY